jgi:hypothetical protein
MASRDLKNNISVVTTLTPSAKTASVTGDTADLHFYEAVAIEAIVGTITDGTHSLTIEESTDGVTFSTVSADFLQGSFSNLASNSVQEIGYLGDKRYIRVNATVTGATSGGTYTVVVVRSRSRKSPV